MIYDILPVNNYIGNNVTKTFDFDFYIDNESQLQVFLYDELEHKIKLLYGVDYSINEFKNKNGSYITFPLDNSSYSVLKDNQKISLELILPISQETQYNNSSLLNLEALEYSLDYLTRLIQILSRKISLCVKVNEGSSKTPDELIEVINNNALSSIESANNCISKLQEIQNLNENIKQVSDEILLNKDKFDLIDDLVQENLSKANISFDNIDDTAKNLIASCASVGSEKIAVATTNTHIGGNVYEAVNAWQAPADGWMVCQILSSEATRFQLSTHPLSDTVGSEKILAQMPYCPAGLGFIYSIKISKGQYFALRSFPGAFSSSVVEFYYDKGAI